MTTAEFKKVGRLLKEVYAELEKEALAEGVDIFGEEYAQVRDAVRLQVLSRMGFTLEEYRAAKELVAPAKKTDVAQQVAEASKLTQDVSARVDAIKIPSEEEILAKAKDIAEQVVKPPVIQNQIVEKTVVEKPTIVRETVTNTVNQEFDPNPIYAELGYLNDRIDNLPPIPEPFDAKGFLDQMRSEFSKNFKENIDTLGMPDFRKLAMGLQAQIDERVIGRSDYPGTPTLYVQADEPVGQKINDLWVDTDVLPGDIDTYTGSLVVDKVAGNGVMVDLGDPTFPWHDLLGTISIRGTGATNPSYNNYRGTIRGYQFNAATSDEVFIEYHMPHDWVPGTDLYLHFHWSLNGKTAADVAAGTVNGGSVTWGAEVSYSKGHNQAAFTSPITFTVQQNASTTTYQHMIAEGQLSSSTPTANQLDTDILEVDGVLIVRLYIVSNDITVVSGSKPDPFLHFADIHYQSTNVGTKGKIPDFYV